MADPDSLPLQTTPAGDSAGDDVPPAAPEIKSFAELKLSAAVLASVTAAGFSVPTPIQAQFIPKALSGRDVMGQAKTGTGKTAAFLLPIFEQLKPNAGVTQALILAPTRELALQIDGEVSRLGASLGFRSVTIYGGSSYDPQIKALKSGVDIVVGTPGRLMDHMQSGRLDLRNIRIAVLDEADRMLDLGFRKDIEYILRHCPADRQTLLLSATIPEDIRKLAHRFMDEPLGVWTSPEKLTVDAVQQYYIVCKRDEKMTHLLKILDVEKPALAIIFCGTKINAKRVAQRLTRLYISAREIHGDLDQQRREKIMGRFRKGMVRLLIATDVASRGLDVNNITHIINYDVPYKIEDYVHRIGRTGRMEKSGKAFTLITPEEGPYLTEIELLINRELICVRFDNLESLWWPNPPQSPPPGFEVPEEHSSEEPRAPHRSQHSRSRPSYARRSAPGPAEADAHAQVTDAPKLLAVAASVSSAPGAASGAILTAGQTAVRPAHAGRPRRQRQRVNIVCGQCGAAAVIGFEPQAGRPVYCDACYKTRQKKHLAAHVEAEVESDLGETGA